MIECDCWFDTYDDDDDDDKENKWQERYVIQIDWLIHDMKVR